MIGIDPNDIEHPVCDRCAMPADTLNRDGLCPACHQEVEEQYEREYRGPPKCLD